MANMVNVGCEDGINLSGEVSTSYNAASNTTLHFEEDGIYSLYFSYLWPSVAGNASVTLGGISLFSLNPNRGGEIYGSTYSMGTQFTMGSSQYRTFITYCNVFLKQRDIAKSLITGVEYTLSNNSLALSGISNGQYGGFAFCRLGGGVTSIYQLILGISSPQ